MTLGVKMVVTLPMVLVTFFHVQALDNDNGGWQFPDEQKIGYDGPCTVERVDGSQLTREQFLKDYAFAKPVIIFNVENNVFKARTRKETMLAEWAFADVTLNSANTYSYTRVPTTFKNYLDTHLKPQSLDTLGNETLYLFGDIDQTLWKPLLSEYKLPQWTLPNYDPALSFGIAASGTGVPFHFHGPGFAEVIHGSKRWFLQPFEDQPDFNPDKSTLDWYINDYPRIAPEKRPLECLMKSGEVIYFPDKWWHATLNAETSVFISTFLSPVVGSRKTEL